MKRFLKSAVCLLAIIGLLAVGSAVTVVAQSPNGIRGAFSGDTFVPLPFSIWFGRGVSGSIKLQHGAANLLVFGPAGAHFGGGATATTGTLASNADFAGTCAIGSTCVLTFTNAYVVAPACVATDQTAAAAVKSAPTTTGVTFTGTGTDTVAYHCFANPN